MSPKEVPFAEAVATAAKRLVDELSAITDSLRLDWVQDNCAMLVMNTEEEGSLPIVTVYVPRITESPADDTMGEAGTGRTFREAIDDAMLAEKAYYNITGYGGDGEPCVGMPINAYVYTEAALESRALGILHKAGHTHCVRAEINRMKTEVGA